MSKIEWLAGRWTCCGVDAKLFDPKLMKPGQMPQRFLSSDAPKKPTYT